ncbi:hypothetical protein GGR59_002576 [Xanthomonas arboricola]|jgi:hypothetical protein|nr:hypothetical protein [Xanthomonas arboricola]
MRLEKNNLTPVIQGAYRVLRARIKKACGSEFDPVAQARHMLNGL